MKLKDIENIENIKLDYKTLTDTALINKYNISRYNIKKIVKEFNLELKQQHILNEKKIETFKKEFPVIKNEILAQKHKVAESTIRMWGANLQLKKKNWSWQQWECDYVLENYESKDMTIEEIANKLERTKFAIINKYRELKGLRPSRK